MVWTHPVLPRNGPQQPTASSDTQEFVAESEKRMQNVEELSNGDDDNGLIDTVWRVANVLRRGRVVLVGL